MQDRILRIHGESDPAHALQLLLDLTTGPARKLISNCIMLPDDQALQEALNLLYKAFGSPSVSIKAHLKLVCEGPQIRTDEKSLRDFHSDLINCKVILETANAGHQLNATSTAKGIFTRFPRYYQEQFAKLAMTKGYDMDIVPFNLFIEFIDQVLSLASSSLGRLMATTKDINRTQQRSCLRPGSKPTPKGWIKLNQQANQQIPRLSTSEKVQTRPVVAAQHTHTDSEKLCPLHTGSRHSLTDCRGFLAMSAEDRWKMVRQNLLCFKCFAANHYTRDCKSNQGCSKCDRPHHELLHREFVSKETNSTSAQNSQRKNTAKPVTDTVKGSSMTETDTLATARQQFCFNNLDQVALMKLVGVPRDQGGHTGGPHQFYAAIDTGATRTICSRRLAEVLFGKWLPCDEKSFKMLIFYQKVATFYSRDKESISILDNCVSVTLHRVTAASTTLPPSTSQLLLRREMK